MDPPTVVRGYSGGFACSACHRAYRGRRAAASHVRFCGSTETVVGEAPSPSEPADQHQDVADHAGSFDGNNSDHGEFKE